MRPHCFTSKFFLHKEVKQVNGSVPPCRLPADGGKNEPASGCEWMHHVRVILLAPVDSMCYIQSFSAVLNYCCISRPCCPHVTTITACEHFINLICLGWDMEYYCAEHTVFITPSLHHPLPSCWPHPPAVNWKAAKLIVFLSCDFIAN